VVDEGITLESVVAESASSANNPSKAAERQQVWAAITDVLQNKLTRRQRQALVATQLNGIPMKTVAKMLNTNPNNLYKLLHDARLKLKKALLSQDLDPEYIIDLFSM